MLAAVAYILGACIDPFVFPVYMLFINGEALTNPPQMPPDDVMRYISSFRSFVRVFPLAMVSGMWTCHLARKEKRNAVAWFLFGFAFNLIGVALFYASLIYEKSCLTQSKGTNSDQDGVRQ